MNDDNDELEDKGPRRLQVTLSRASFEELRAKLVELEVFRDIPTTEALKIGPLVIRRAKEHPGNVRYDDLLRASNPNRKIV